MQDVWSNTEDVAVLILCAGSAYCYCIYSSVTVLDFREAQAFQADRVLEW